MKKINKFLICLSSTVTIIAMTGCGNKQMDLQKAVIAGDAKKINQLVKDGADVNYKDKKTSAYLLIDIALRKNVKVLKALVDAGIKLDKSKAWSFGQMAKCAHNRDNIEKVNLMLKAGAEVNDQGPPLQLTVLMTAASSGNLELVKFLLKKGADPSLKDNKNRTAYDFAFKKRKVFDNFEPKYMKLLAFFEKRGITSQNPEVIKQRKKDLELIAERKRIAAQKREKPRSLLVYKFLKYNPQTKCIELNLQNRTGKTIITYKGAIDILHKGKTIGCCGLNDLTPSIAFNPGQTRNTSIPISIIPKSAKVDLNKDTANFTYEFVVSEMTFKDGNKIKF